MPGGVEGYVTETLSWVNPPADNDVNLKNLYSDMFNKSDSWSKYPMGDADVISKVDNNQNFIDESQFDTE